MRVRGKHLGLFVIVAMCICICGLFSFASADYEDGADCPYCGHYHWDSYMCGVCGGCSDECTNEDCYSEHHCQECGACETDMPLCPDCYNCLQCLDFSFHCIICYEEKDVCSTCGACEDCIEEYALHCPLCQECSEDVEWCDEGERHCTACCVKCSVCEECFADDVSYWCEFCGKCCVCGFDDGTHCIGCGDGCRENDDFCDVCGWCMDCVDGNEYAHCLLCGACYEGVDRCEDDGTHCVDCCEPCPTCGFCMICVGDEYKCDECGLCIGCCHENAEEYGCSCGEYCIEDPDFERHICESCLGCFDPDDMCEYCGFCPYCCEDNQCEHGVCCEDAEGIEAHTCVDCGDCFSDSELCDECDEVRCLDCCAVRTYDEYGCEHGICLDSGDWDDHFCSDCESCIEEYCDICGGCYNCCSTAKEDAGCSHDFTCPNDSSWEEHFCDKCGDCFEPDEMCEYCGLCLDCCEGNANDAGCDCGYYVCVENPDWEDHFCTNCDCCMSECKHKDHSHIASSIYKYDSNAHWFTCTLCGNKLSRGLHRAGDWITDKTATTTTQGSKHQECLTCGYKMKTATIPVISSSHTCSYGNAVYNMNQHWNECKVCGAEKAGSRSKHSIVNHKCSCGYTDIAKPVIVKQMSDITVAADADRTVIKLDAVGDDLSYDWEIEYPDMTGSDSKTTKSGIWEIDLRDVISELSCRDKYPITCKVSNVAGSVTAETAYLTLAHTPASKWSSDAVYHWKDCANCSGSIKMNKAQHIFESDGTCKTCGRVAPPEIVTQPSDVTAKYQPDTEKYVTFRVKVKGDVASSLSKIGSVLGKSTAVSKVSTKVTASKKPVTVNRGQKLAKAPSYQWYFDAGCKYPVQEAGYFTGVTTPALKVKMNECMCTDEENGNGYTFYCKVTNASGDVVSKGARLIAEHNLNTWENDNTNHWQVCYCSTGTKRNEGKHVMSEEWKVISPATKTETGLKAKKCTTCKYQITEIIPVETTHVHSLGTSYGKNKLVHWQNCTECGYSEKAPHTFGEWQVVEEKDIKAGNIERKDQIKKCVCTVCGFEKWSGAISAEEKALLENGQITEESKKETDKISGEKSNSGKEWSNASDWAVAQLEKAQTKGLIPVIIKNGDMTKPVTRKEFAAIAVKMYEGVSGKKATPISVNPFSDTSDLEVMKAYNLGITSGMSATTFAPDNKITREQMAKMMASAVKAAIPNERTEITVDEITNAFADHNGISGWAISGVYYMAGKGIINGMGNNNFGPSGTATREQAMTISVKSLETLKK